MRATLYKFFSTRIEDPLSTGAALSTHVVLPFFVGDLEASARRALAKREKKTNMPSMPASEISFIASAVVECERVGGGRWVGECSSV